MSDRRETPTDDFEIADPVPDAYADEGSEEPPEEWEERNTDDPVQNEV